MAKKERMAPKLSSRVRPGGVRPKPSVELSMFKGKKGKK
jgi:hypothetical protein